MKLHNDRGTVLKVKKSGGGGGGGWLLGKSQGGTCPGGNLGIGAGKGKRVVGVVGAVAGENGGGGGGGLVGECG